MLEDLIKESATRRDVFKAIGATALAGALLGAAGFDPAIAQELKPSGKPLKAALANAGLQATWCAQGKQAAEAWGKLMNVEITWFDGELSATKQRAAIDNMATQKWDFVAIQTFGIGTLNDPIKKMIDCRHAGDRHGHDDGAGRPARPPHLHRARQRLHGLGRDQRRS